MTVHHYRPNGQTRPQDIRVCWVNVGKSSPCHIAALQLAHDDNLDIICVQEPFTMVGSRTSTHPGYTYFSPVSSWDNREQWESQRPRVLTYVRKGARLQVSPRLSLNDRDLLWLEVNGLSILNVYRQPQTPQVLEYVTHLSPPPRCLIGGDFNAKHDTFEPGAPTSHGGAELAHWASDSGMDYIGEPGRPTHRAGHVIDLSFSNVPFANTTVREDLSCGSDHCTLVTTVPGRGREPLDQFHYRIPQDRLQQFSGVVELELASVPSPMTITSFTSTAQIDDCVSALTGAFDRAIRMVGKLDRGTGRAAPWWTNSCAAAHRRHLAATRGTYNRGATEETREFLAEVRRAKRDYWRHTIDTIRNDKDLYRVIGWHKLEPNRQESPLVVNDQTIVDPLQKAEALREAILCRFDSTDDLEHPPDFTDTEAQLPWDTSLSMEETERNVIGVSSTSPGVDRVTVRLLKACWEHVRHTLRAIYQRCLALSHFPTQWKLAEVAMLPKVGKKDKTSPRS